MNFNKFKCLSTYIRYQQTQSATRLLSTSPDLISFSSVLDLNMFKFNPFIHQIIQFYPKTLKWANYHFAPDILHFLQFSPYCIKHKIHKISQHYS